MSAPVRRKKPARRTTPGGTGEKILLVDVSNSFTKMAVARRGVIGRVVRIPTKDLASRKASIPRADRAVISCVVPPARKVLGKLLPARQLWLDHKTPSGVAIRYPSPATIGADRLANAAAAVRLGKLPAIVVDFGTAVTFDVVDAAGCYLGGIIAPGLITAAAALHQGTALLPRTGIRGIFSSIGKSTGEAIRIGLLLGAVGLIREAVERITREAFGGRKATVIATGGNAELVSRLASGGAGGDPVDVTDPLLTLRGLLVIAEKNP